MDNIEIINNINDEDIINKIFVFVTFFVRSNFKTLKKIFHCLLSLFIFIIFILDNIYHKNDKNLKPFKKYVNDCKKSIKYNRTPLYNNNFSYVSICLSALNMENYIEKNLLSIINQSFQNFQIVVVDDNSKDRTVNIIQNLQREDSRIKLISHKDNLGVYRARIEAIINSNSQYILIMDPDDMYFNENLLQKLFDYNSLYNFDIIEFSVYQQYVNFHRIFLPNNHYESHFHGFSKTIIYQPDLSEILYFIPNTHEYSYTICRNIWNKIIRRDIFIDTYKFIGNEYFEDFVITADDMILNIISYQFAKNYTNIDLPGYLYVLRKLSMSRGKADKKLMKIRAFNYLSYFKLFYKYLKNYNKDRNFLYYEMKDLDLYIKHFKDKSMVQYKLLAINFLKSMLNDLYISDSFKLYLMDLLEQLVSN